MSVLKTRDNAYTSDRREAYEFAKLLLVVDGIKHVKVEILNGIEFRVVFDIESDIHQHTLYVELVTLLKEYDLTSFYFHGGTNWENALKQHSDE